MQSPRTGADRSGQCSREDAGFYEVRVIGRLNKEWSEWLGGLRIDHQGQITILAGRVADQAALRGILCRIWDLNLTVVSLKVLDKRQRRASSREGKRRCNTGT